MDNVQWIKLKVGMFDGESFKKIKKAKIGGESFRDKLTAVWFELMDFAGKCNHSGFLINSREIPFQSISDIAVMIDRTTEELDLCMKFFINEGMVEIIDDIYLLSNWMMYQNEDKLAKIREQKRISQAKWRMSKKLKSEDTSDNAKSDVESTGTSTAHLPSYSISNSSSTSGNKGKEGKVVNNFETNKGKTIDSFKNKYVEGLIDSYAIYQDILTTSNKTHHYILTSWIDESYILPIKNETKTTKQTNEETYKFKVKVVGVDTPITIEEKSSGAKGTDTLIALTNNKDSSGLYTITHPADNTLQIGANESITEYRYRGASPKNYVTFNNEVWRIIGVFPTDDGTGKIENRIKIVRNESIGIKYWDTSGSNNWARPATLNTELNTTYLNSLDSTSQSMIGNTKYYLGGTADYWSDGYVDTPLQFYSYERKIMNKPSISYFYSGNPNNWVGKIALMYASDYGYASENCEGKRIYDTRSLLYDIRACNDMNWLYNIKTDEWLLSQVSTNKYYVFSISSIGSIVTGGVTNRQYAVRPTLYLTSSIKITGGSGTSSNPYTLGI